MIDVALSSKNCRKELSTENQDIKMKTNQQQRQKNKLYC